MVIDVSFIPHIWKVLIDVATGPSVCGEQCPDVDHCQICASDDVKDAEVDFIVGQTYGETNLDEDPVLFPQCGHFITLSNMDGQMDMARHYAMGVDGSLMGLKGASEPVLDGGQTIKSCPTCRGSLRNISRYGRIVRRALLDEATKKFIVWANGNYIPLANQLPDMQKKLQNTTAEDSHTLILAKTDRIRLGGSRSDQIRIIVNSRGSRRYRGLLALRNRAQIHLNRVRVQEQPFRRVWDMVQTARRLDGKAHGSFKFGDSVLHPISELRATALLFRCDVTLLSDFVKQRQQLTSDGMQGELSVDLEMNRKDCLALIELAESAGDKLRQMEGHLFFASFVAIERMVGFESKSELRDEALEHTKKAESLPDDSTPYNFEGVLAELKEVAYSLKHAVFYSPVLNDEWKAVFSAMSQEFFSSTGHWYRCVNGHPFTVGECGRPMESTRCPECGAPVGGHQHREAEGVERMDEIERRFGSMDIE